MLNIKYMNDRKKELGFTNKKLAEESGVPMGTISKITAGLIADPKLGTLQAIASALKCTLDDLSVSEETNKSSERNSEFVASELEKKLILRFRGSGTEMQDALLRMLGIE